MPQVFQILRCYKCSTFQVHQTKKANKFECKICGEKQSIKRYYGLGTAKECRIHVQKLNGIRGEIDELKETTRDSDNDVDSEPVDVKPNIANLKPKKSKWSDFIDKLEDTPEPGPSESMYLCDSEIVLEVPKKRRNLGKRGNKRCPTISKANSDCCSDNISTKMEIEVYRSNTSLPFSSKFCETNDDATFIKTINSTLSKIESVKNKTDIRAPKKFVTPVVNNTKWAQFVETKDETEDQYDFNNTRELIKSENCENNDDFITKDDTIEELEQSERYIFCTKNKSNLFKNSNVMKHDKEKAAYQESDMEKKKDLSTCSKPIVKRNPKRAHFLDTDKSDNKEDICESVENINDNFLNPLKADALFALCDDNDLDEILDI